MVVDFTIILLVAIVSYVVFIGITNFYKGDGTMHYFIKQKLSGFLLLFIFPAIVSSLIGFKYSFIKIYTLEPSFSFYLPLMVGIILVFNHYFTSKYSGIRERYPEMRFSVWSISHVLLGAIGWFIFLFGYEFLFRGLLLYAALEVMPVFWAILLNITLYALAHLPKSKDEVIGAFFFGIILCFVTIKTGNIWFAVILHFVQAFSTGLFSIKNSPEMHFVKSKADE